VIKVVAVDFASDSGFIHCGVVYFNSIEEGKKHVASTMYTRLLKYERRGKLGSKLQRIPGAQIPMSVRWFTYRVLEHTLEWTSVILRGLRRDINKHQIEETFPGISIRAEPPREINGEVCTIAIVKGICDADKIIRHFRNVGLGGKADIHPYSSMFKSPEQSAEIIFHEYRKKRKMMMPPSVLKMLKIEEHSDSEDARSLISEVSGTVEDGEITDTDAPSSETTQNFYVLYEHPGSYMNSDGEASLHSGVCIKTVFQLAA
jgi:hypothetical protein